MLLVVVMGDLYRHLSKLGLVPQHVREDAPCIRGYVGSNFFLSEALRHDGEMGSGTLKTSPILWDNCKGQFRVPKSGTIQVQAYGTSRWATLRDQRFSAEVLSQQDVGPKPGSIDMSHRMTALLAGPVQIKRLLHQDLPVAIELR